MSLTLQRIFELYLTNLVLMFQKQTKKNKKKTPSFLGNLSSEKAKPSVYSWSEVLSFSCGIYKAVCPLDELFSVHDCPCEATLAKLIMHWQLEIHS